MNSEVGDITMTLELLRDAHESPVMLQGICETVNGGIQ